MTTTLHTHVPRSKLCRYNEKAVWYGDEDLVGDLLGKTGFVDVFMKQTFGVAPSVTQRRVIEAVLVTLMEHGMTPSAIAARMIYASSPENLQAGVAAGLLAVASRFVGTMEPAAELLEAIVTAGGDREDETLSREYARRIAQDFRQRRVAVPGFGHHLHRPDDPRAAALLALARECDTNGRRCRALALLSAEIDAVVGRHITINATGAIAAVLGDIGIPAPLMRGFAVLGRAAGLIAHIAEEQRDPSGRFIWDLVDGAMSEHAEPVDEPAGRRGAPVPTP